jgi:DNA-directed RNA polymerase I and III subunit RPAC1
VELARIKDFFLCTTFLIYTIVYAYVFGVVNVESEGPYKPEDLPSEAIKVLRDKIAVVKRAAMGLQEDLKDDNVEMEDDSGIRPK